MRARSLLVCLLVAESVLLACGTHQYIGVPRANAEESITKNLYTDRTTHAGVPPTATVVTGSPKLVLGASATVRVGFSTVTDIEVKQLLLLVLNQDGKFFGYWEWDLSPEELAAGSADIEVFALAQEPTKEWCQKDHRGQGSCAHEVDEGITGFSVVPGNASITGWPGINTPFTLAPLTGGNKTCSSFTKAECCAGSPGIAAISCNIDPVCKCPDGTGIGGLAGDGTRVCTCQ